MQSALHITTRVLPGNRVEVQLPFGSEGQEVNVFIVLPMTIRAASIQNGIALLPQAAAAGLARIRSRPRVNPADFGLPDSTVLIQDDRNR